MSRRNATAGGHRQSPQSARARRWLHVLTWAATWLVAPLGVASAEEPVKAQLVVEATELLQGHPVRVGVHFAVAPGWHLYGPEPGDAGLAIHVALTSPQGSLSPLVWPAPSTFREQDALVTYGYTDEVLAVGRLVAAEDAPPALTLSADVRYLACNVICRPGRAQLRQTLPVLPRPRAADAAATAAARTRVDGSAGAATKALFARLDGRRESFAAAAATAAAARSAPAATPDPLTNAPATKALPSRGPATAPAAAPAAAGTVLSVLLLAFLGGLLLNAMPCVLPVLALKVASLAQLGPSKSDARKQAAGYALGVLLSLEALAAVVWFLRATGEEVGWGFQMQQPLFLAAVAVALVVFAGNCLGAFELIPNVDGLARAHAAAHGLRRSLLEGVLAVLVATPCSTPFLGTAVAFAFGQPTPVLLATFASIGLGLCTPYLLLVLLPGTRRLLPRPGPWMVAVKQALGLALLATAGWLGWVLGRSQGVDAMAALLLLAWLAAAGSLLLGALVRRLPQQSGLGLACLVSLLLACTGALAPLLRAPAEGPLTGGPGGHAEAPGAWSAATVAGLLAKNRPVFVDFTADWCVTCQYNARHVLAAAEVQRAFAAAHVGLLVADWTRQDPEILAELRAHGRAGVPLYLLYWPGRPEPLVLPEVLTVQRVLSSLAQAARGPSPGQ